MATKNLVLGLTSTKRCEKFAEEFATVSDLNRIFHKYPEFFAEFSQLNPDSCRFLALKWRDMLRASWEATDMRLRDWYLYELRHAHATKLNALRKGIDQFDALRQAIDGDQEGLKALFEASQPVPEATHLEAAFYYLQKRAQHRMRICANEACDIKYFLRSQTNAKQTCCSTECANIVRKATKRNWWMSNRGKEAI